MSSSRVVLPPPAPERPKATIPSEAFIDQQIRRTRRQVKWVEIFQGLLTLLVVGLTVLFLAALLDHWAIQGGLPSWARWLWGAGLAGWSLGYFWVKVLPLIVYRIHPLYAAQTIESAQPSLRNNLINFLLLRNDPRGTPEPVLRAVEESAARQLVDVAPEAVVDRSPVIRLGYALVAVVALVALYIVLSPKNPLVSFGRVLWPWADIPAPTRVRIEKVEPGSITVPRGESVQVSAQVRGLADGEEVFFYYSTTDGQIVQQAIPMRPLEPGQTTYRLPVDSFTARQDTHYFIQAGDARSPTFTIQVEIPLVITAERLVYEYPHYTGLGRAVVQGQGDIRAVEGTKVTIEASANLPLSQAEIDLDGQGRWRLPMRVEGQSAKGELVLRTHPRDRLRGEYSSYLLRAQTLEGETNRRPTRYMIEVLPDRPPRVDLRLGVLEETPEEIQVPRSRSVEMRVEAEDPDFGLRRVSIPLQKQGQMLQTATLLDWPKVPEREAATKVASAKSSGPQGPEGHQGPFQATWQFNPAALGLKAGDVVFYWARAEDTKLPTPNAAETPRRRIVIVEDPPGQPPASAQEPQGQKGPGQPPPMPPDPSQQQPGEKQSTGEKEQPGEKQPSGEKQPPGQEGSQKPESGQEKQQPDQEKEQPGQEKQQPGEKQSTGEKQQPGEKQPPSQEGSQKPQPGSEATQQSEPGSKEATQNAESPGQGATQSEGASQPQGSPKPEQSPTSPAQQPDGGRKPEPGESSEGGQKPQPGPQPQTGDQPGSSPSEKSQPQPGQTPSQTTPSGQSESSSSSQPGSAGDSSGSRPDSGQPSAAGQEGPQGDEPSAQPGPKTPPQRVDPVANPGKAFEEILRDRAEQTGAAKPESSDSQSSGTPREKPSQEKSPQDKLSTEKSPQETAGSSGQTPPSGIGKEAPSPGQAKPAPGQPKPAGAEEPPQGKPPADQGPPEAQEANQPRTGPSQQKPPESQGESQAQSPSISKRQSDSRGDQEGDRSGGGQQGGGQQAPQPGMGSPGSQSPASEGSGTSNQPGPGQQGTRPGQQTPSPQPTGQAGEKTGPGQSGQDSGSGTKSPQSPPSGKPKPASEKPEEASDSLPKTLPKGPERPGGSPDRPGVPTEGTSSEKPTAHGAGNPQTGGMPSRSAGPPMPNEPLQGDDPNLEYTRQAVDMALEHLRDRLREGDLRILEKLRWSREDAESFLRRWEAMKRQAAESPPGSPAQKQLQEVLKNLGLRPQGVSRPAGEAKPDDLRRMREGRTVPPPPDWAEQFRAFRRGIRTEE